MAIWQLLEVHPDSAWAGDGLEGMIFQTKKPHEPYHIGDIHPDWYYCTEIHVLNSPVPMYSSSLCIAGFKARRLFK